MQKAANPKPSAPVKSVLKKGSKETINIYKHELAVDVRIRVQYTRKKNEVSKKVCVCLAGGFDFIRETFLEGKTDVAFLGKEGRKLKKKLTKTTADFPSTTFELTKNYASVLNLFAFNDGRQGTSKVVDLCMVLGTDTKIEPLLEEWRMNFSEKGIKIRKKQCKLVHNFDKSMFLGIPTGVPITVVER